MFRQRDRIDRRETFCCFHKSPRSGSVSSACDETKVPSTSEEYHLRVAPKSLTKVSDTIAATSIFLKPIRIPKAAQKGNHGSATGVDVSGGLAATERLCVGVDVDRGSTDPTDWNPSDGIIDARRG